MLKDVEIMIFINCVFNYSVVDIKSEAINVKNKLGYLDIFEQFTCIF